MTMQKIEINDPEKVKRIKAEIRDTHIVAGVTAVRIGEHPEHGHVVLIETKEGSLLLGDAVRFL